MTNRNARWVHWKPARLGSHANVRQNAAITITKTIEMKRRKKGEDKSRQTTAQTSLTNADCGLRKVKGEEEEEGDKP